MTQHNQPATDEPRDWLGLVTSRDPAKPTFKQLRTEGLSPDAIDTLWIASERIDDGEVEVADAVRVAAKKGLDGRDQANIAEHLRAAIAAEVLDFLRHSQRLYPVTEADVFPTGRPAHWDRCDECGLFLVWDEHDLCGRDGAPGEQWQVTTPSEVFS